MSHGSVSTRTSLGARCARPRGAVVLAAAIVALLAVATNPAGASTKAGAGDSQSRPRTASVTGMLNAVSCVSSSDCEAVGSYGSGDALAEVWDGTTWTVQTVPPPAGSSDVSLAGVACQSSGDCVAVGGYFEGDGDLPLAETWNGSSWTDVSVAMPSGAIGGDLAGVSCSPGGVCMAVGDYANAGNENQPLSDLWNGASFTAEAVPLPAGAGTSTLGAVGCTGEAPDCEAFGWDFQNGIENAIPLGVVWKGKHWTQQTVPFPDDSGGGTYPTGVSCNSAKSCIAVGAAYDGEGDLTDGWVMTWNGTEWSNGTLIDPPSEVSGYPTAVTCLAGSKKCTTAGYYSNGSEDLAIAEGWNGTTWTVDTTPLPKGATSSNFSGVTCYSSTWCIATGTDLNSSGVDVTLAESSKGGLKWKTMVTPSP